MGNYSSRQEKRIIIYYQTLVDLSSLLEEVKAAPSDKPILTHITLSSIHFGYNSDKSPYIHLNDDDPDANKFVKVYNQLREFKKLGIKINLLIGGAGGAFERLFSDYQTFYKLLKNTINIMDFIDGFNIDIEEEVSIENMALFLNDLNKDYSNKDIVFAPLGSSIASNQPGMGGFAYKDLIKAIPNIKIDYYNTQCYYDYSLEIFEEMINNGYNENEIVLGMLVGQDFNVILQEIEKIVKKYPNVGGVAIWEYWNAPQDWCKQVSSKLFL